MNGKGQNQTPDNTPIPARQSADLSELNVIEPNASESTTTKPDIMTAVPDNAVIAPANDNSIYSFHDAAVKYEVAKYFGKNASELTANDFKALSDLTSFKIYGYSNVSVAALTDLPEILPNLRYLFFTNYGEPGLSTVDFEILENMRNLRGISIYSDCLDSLAFAKPLAYVDIQYTDYAYLSEENNLGELSLLGEFALNMLTGNIREYVRIIENGRAFELFCTDSTVGDPIDDFYEAKLIISEQSGNEYRYIGSFDVPDRAADASGGLILADADFNGEDDILIKQGHFGTQGLVTFVCFLKRGDSYSLNDSFSHIANPSLDKENCKVLSTWRNMATSHSWAMYSFIDDAFVLTDCLTEEETDEGWKWIGERNIGGKDEFTEVYFKKDLTKEELQALIYEDGGFWELYNDKWLTLNNLGSYMGYSIYGSSDINAQVNKIINND